MFIACYMHGLNLIPCECASQAFFFKLFFPLAAFSRGDYDGCGD